MSNIREKIRDMRLSQKLSIHIIFAFTVSVLLVVLMFILTEYFLINSFIGSDKWNAKLKVEADNIQKFITDRGITSDRADELRPFFRENPRLFVYIYDDTSVLFETNYAGVEYGGDVYRTLQFADRSAEMYISYAIGYKVYYSVIIAEIIIGMIFFLNIVLRRVRRIVNEIDRLEGDIRALEGGSFEHEIKVSSTDDLRNLEKSLDDMRIALMTNLQREEALTHANMELVTRMSHDLRTPLTSLLLYLDLIGKKKYKDEEQLQKYLSVSRSKAEQIKSMSDMLFERFLLTGENEEESCRPVSARYALEDPLSSFVMTLNAHGYKTLTNIKWPEVRITASVKYIDRILDNLYSNIIKYADPDKAISIILGMDGDDRLCVNIKNHIGRTDMAEGSGIGTENIRIMMEILGGSLVIRNDGRTYETELEFAVLK